MKFNKNDSAVYLLIKKLEIPKLPTHTHPIGVWFPTPGTLNLLTAPGGLREAGATLTGRLPTTKRTLDVQALKAIGTVMCTQQTLVNI